MEPTPATAIAAHETIREIASFAPGAGALEFDFSLLPLFFNSRTAHNNPAKALATIIHPTHLEPVLFATNIKKLPHNRTIAKEMALNMSVILSAVNLDPSDSSTGTDQAGTNSVGCACTYWTVKGDASYCDKEAYVATNEAEPCPTAPFGIKAGAVGVVDGVVTGVDVPVSVVGVQRCVDRVLLGPGAGGGVVEALTELDVAGGAVLDAVVEDEGVVEPASVVAAGVQAGDGAVGVIAHVVGEGVRGVG